ncbi:MAG: hypothetical protein LBU25_04990 [Treponema sp.]|nr:hypothetical protein [Treponema sp.]
MEAGEVTEAADAEGTDGEGSGGEENRWKYMRGLGVYEGRILFSYDHDGRMYKLGMADPRGFLKGNGETIEVVFS